MMTIEDAVGMLGCRVQDKVTGLKGVVSSMSFDLYGCVQAIVNPGIGKDGKMRDCVWLDVNRITVLDKGRKVMNPPDFIRELKIDKGPESKPVQGP